MSGSGSGERRDEAHVRFGIRLRNAVFGPVARAAVGMGITQHHVTFARALLLPAGVLVGYLYSKAWCAAIFLTIALLDMTDGFIARERGDPSDRGKFSDVIVDFACYNAVTFLMAMWGVVDVPIAMWLMMAAPLGYVLAVIAKNEGKPTDWLIHPFPNHMLYIVCNTVPFLLYALGGIDFYFNLFYFMTAAVMTFHVARYFWVIQKRWFFT